MDCVGLLNRQWGQTEANVQPTIFPIRFNSQCLNIQFWQKDISNYANSGVVPNLTEITNTSFKRASPQYSISFAALGS